MKATKSMGARGMVASPHYLATGAGAAVLRDGGTAVDAAIATNAVLAVVTPYVCGLGGDLFAQVYTSADGRLTGLNGSGRAPAAATADTMRRLAQGDEIPARGPLSITVPGCVEAWGQLHRRFGRLPLKRVLQDAVTYARDGFPVSATFAQSMRMVASFLHPDTPAPETFLPGGNVPKEGQILVQSRIARTLEAIAGEGPDVYYRGWIGQEIARSVQSIGGLITEADLAEHTSDWVEPLSVEYRGVTVYELPPNTQGVIALLMLNILGHLPEEPIRAGTEEYVHLLAEVQRLAYADRAAHLTDIDHMTITPQEMLAESYAEERAARVPDVASETVLTGTPGDTIYLCTADGDGNLCSLIESNWMGIGSGVMAGETGVMMQNRGNWFSLRPGHANIIAPRKRTMHTLIPGMVFRGDRPWLVFGSMGGSMQAQIHIELLTRLIDQEADVHAAVDAPRFDGVTGRGENGRPRIRIEDRFPSEVVEGLRRRGNDVELIAPYSSAMGHAHVIKVLDNGAYAGAADPRSEGLAQGY